MVKNKVGITADDYKLNKFRVELTKAGYEFKINPFTKNTSLISVKITNGQEDIRKINKICQLVELHFKRGN